MEWGSENCDLMLSRKIFGIKSTKKSSNTSLLVLRECESCRDEDPISPRARPDASNLAETIEGVAKSQGENIRSENP